MWSQEESDTSSLLSHPPISNNFQFTKLRITYEGTTSVLIQKKTALNLNNCNQFYFSKTNVRQTFSITWIPKDNSEKNEDKRDNQGVQNQKENIHVNKKIQESYQVFQILIKPSSFNGSQVSLLEGQISFPCFYPSHPLGKAATGKVIFQAIRAKQLRSSITVTCKTSIFKQIQNHKKATQQTKYLSQVVPAGNNKTEQARCYTSRLMRIYPGTDIFA